MPERTLCGLDVGGLWEMRVEGSLWEPGEKTCETCLRIDRKRGPVPGSARWAQKRPALSWHVVR